MKSVVITSLAMRFYKHHGWTEDDLKKYLKRGSLALRGFGDEELENQYWIMEVGSQIDVDKMFEDGVVDEDNVLCKDQWGETRDLTGREAMKRRNW